MDDTVGQPGPTLAGSRPTLALPAAITGWIEAGGLDAELAALVSILAEGGLPLVVAAPTATRGSGWSGSDVRDALGRTLAGPDVPARSRIRAAAPVTVDAGSLEAVLARMPLLSLEAADDLGARVAIVIVVGADETDGRWRARAAHFLRPPLRDGHGHLQRQGPAVLATWDPVHEQFEHFAWAVLPELAVLIQRHAGDLEADIAARTDLLSGLVAHHVTDPGAVRLAIDAARAAAGSASHRH